MHYAVACGPSHGPDLDGIIINGNMRIGKTDTPVWSAYNKALITCCVQSWRELFKVHERSKKDWMPKARRLPSEAARAVFLFPKRRAPARRSLGFIGKRNRPLRIKPATIITTENPRVRKSGVMDGGVRLPVSGVGW